MCGIVAAIAARNIVPVLIEGLNKLEYRGYDSAGIALPNPSLRVAPVVFGPVGAKLQYPVCVEFPRNDHQYCV